MIIYRKKQREGDKYMTKVSFAKKLHTEQCSMKLYATKEETISTKNRKDSNLLPTLPASFLTVNEVIIDFQHIPCNSSLKK